MCSLCSLRTDPGPWRMYNQGFHSPERGITKRHETAAMIGGSLAKLATRSSSRRDHGDALDEGWNSGGRRKKKASETRGRGREPWMAIWSRPNILWQRERTYRDRQSVNVGRHVSTGS